MKKLLSNYLQHETAKEIAELKAEITELKKDQNGRNDEMTIGAQMLLFHYLNIQLPIELNRNKKAMLLKHLFNAEGDGNIKKYISELGNSHSKESKEPFTISNLKRVEQIFDTLELKKQLDQVGKDLKNKQLKK